VQNYRTHSGILKLGSSVLEMLFNHFPNSIDKVPAENGALFIGETPIFVEQSHQNLTENLFGTDDKDQSGIEMGAHQCIIVRSDEVKRRLQIKMPIALILTVTESKGMEVRECLNLVRRCPHLQLLR
jgi:hypothetical protein